MFLLHPKVKLKKRNIRFIFHFISEISKPFYTEMSGFKDTVPTTLSLFRRLKVFTVCDEEADYTVPPTVWAVICV